VGLKANIIGSYRAMPASVYSDDIATSPGLVYRCNFGFVTNRSLVVSCVSFVSRLCRRVQKAVVWADVLPCGCAGDCSFDFAADAAAPLLLLFLLLLLPHNLLHSFQFQLAFFSFALKSEP
jgi:hypothetical protein